MSLMFVLFILLTAAFLLPSQISSQKKALMEVEDSLQVRLQQLEQEFKFRSRELARRLKGGDLDQQEWLQLSDELKLDTAESIQATQIASKTHKALPSTITAIVLLLAVGGVAFIGYFSAGYNDLAGRYIEINSRLKSEPLVVEELSKKAETDNSQETLETLYMALRSQAELKPLQVDNWRALASFNSRVGRDKEALQALDKALALQPANPDIQLEKAQYLAGSDDQDDKLRAFRMLSGIVKSNPEHEGARVMLGFNAFALGFYQLAIDSWEQVLKNRDDGSSAAEMLHKSIQAARQRLAGKPTAEVKSVPAGDARIAVKLDISKAVRDSLSGSETVFVFAKAVDGPKFPLAVVKTGLAELNNPIILSDANAMSEEYKLSSFDSVQIIVRISQTGDAIARPGDLEVKSDVINGPFENNSVVLKL